MRLIANLLLFLGVALVPSLAPAQEAEVENFFGNDTPSISTTRKILRLAEEEGWKPVADALRRRTVESYLKGEIHDETWYYHYRWAKLLGTSEDQLTREWVAALKRANLIHTNMPSDYSAIEAPLGDRVSRDLAVFLLENRDFSRQFFDLVRPYDDPVLVIDILNSLYQLYPSQFRRYQALALAIAVVYDVPPPPGWPHGQVSQDLLPREMPSPENTFDYFTRVNDSRFTAFDLSDLSPNELKFVVDTPLTIRELHWARSEFKEMPLEKLEQVYDQVEYNFDRLKRFQFHWPEQDYSMKTILEVGGICVDQAYFAANAGKARGVPTLIFRGAGNDGRHAWFGFKDGRKSWYFDAGRYGENVFVTGVAHDPQTWKDVTDHQLKFLNESFHESGAYRESNHHANMAFELFNTGHYEEGLDAAETAVRIERRNSNAWQTLIAIERSLAEDPRELEDVYESAARAFTEYPDVEAYYRQLLADSLEERGEVARANLLRKGLAISNSDGRSDLSIDQAVHQLNSAMQKLDTGAQTRTFRTILREYSSQSGMQVFDRLVRPFVGYLYLNGMEREARHAAEFAAESLQAPVGSQLHMEIRRLVAATGGKYQ